MAMALQFRHRATTITSRTSSKLATTHRQYASSSRDSSATLLEGKSEGALSSLWSKYKLYAIGAGGAIAAVGLLGVAASAVAVGGIASIAGGVYMWYRNKMAHQQSVLKTEYEPLIEKNRKDIERFIGPFVLPDTAGIAADSDDITTSTGGSEAIIRNVFYIDGKYGKGLVRALGVKQEDGTFKLRKLIVDAQDFRRTMQDTFTLVDLTPKPTIIDAVEFKHYDLSDYVEVKRAARAAQRIANRNARAEKDSPKKQTLHSNKPSKKKAL